MNKKATILYVDDEEDNLITFRAYFRRHYQTLIAQSGEAALTILADKSVDLVISDQRMPEMTGVELLEKVRLQHPEIIRLVLTGYSDMEAIVKAINIGKIYHYATKPFQPEELKVILDKALEVKALKSQNAQLQLEKQALLLKTAQAEQANTQAQYEALKNQVNPHFLFNSLNILNTLIHADIEKAKTFIAKFSKLYRQLLELREVPLISLEKELAFVQNYLFLQQIRFDDSLKVTFDISDSAKLKTLPPFCLQFLVENAIK
ncbi:MAG: histidine kinase, partial [Bacteroidota bacterium]